MVSDIALPGIGSPVVADYCARSKITELALFESALRADFADDSDVDLLVTFSDEAKWS